MYVEYSSNNSGGRWWLDDEDWKKLEAAGWVVHWYSLECQYNAKGDYVRNTDGTPVLVPLGQGNNRFSGSFIRQDEQGDYRRLGALASNAHRTGLSLREAADEWERITGKSSTEAGCPCCGQPHNFTEYDDAGEYVASGPSTSYSASW